MKKYYPEYYKMFSCIADKCPDSCCKKWEIVIDSNTINKYEKLESSFGEKIKSFISKDEEGDCCFALEDGKCPFLNSEGLCDIHIELGEDYTSEICRNHPRFIEEYDGFTEISLSLSCPEANRIIMTSLTDNVQYSVPDYLGDDEVLALLIESRTKILNERNDIFTLIRGLLDTAADDALDIDLVYIENHPDINVSFLKNFAEMLLSHSEILTDEWKNYLTKIIASDVSDEEMADFMRSDRENLIKICHYFTYRYYLKAVNDLDIYSRALFIATACYFSAFVALACSMTSAEAARFFSKEIEHNLYNLDLMLKYFSRF